MTIRNLTIVTVAGLILAMTGPARAWLVDNNNDSQSVGSPCGVFNLAPWQDSTISSGESASPPNSCKFAVAQGQDGLGGTFPHSYLYKGGEVWFQFKMFMPAGFDYGAYGAGDRLKFISVGVRTAGGTPTTLYVELQREGSALTPYTVGITSGPNNPFWKDFGAAGDKPQRGVWDTYEVYLKFDNVSVDDGGTGRLRFWKNNKLIGDITNLGTLNNATDYSKHLGILTYWNAGSPKTQHLYIDDIKATDQKPTNTDANGNPYIGVGTGGTIASPLPPSSIQ